jgi:hypothetical protein
MNGKLYQGVADAELSSMAEATNVKDVTLSLSTGEADISTRANSGWKATVATLRECQIEFEMIWKPSDTIFSAIKTAFLASTTITLAALTGEKDVSGSEGIHGNFAITNFSRQEPLTEGMTVKVTAKLAKFIAWVVCN